ncbi:MAG: hypothetical protein H6835_02505 [Planctomycetes bacterium]|nr:hypothetical protein [Planctomycetota bacterium]
MTAQPLHPVLRSLAEAPGPRPLVAAHRGDSRHHPENTLSAFRAATSLGVAVQEFDVRQLRCGALVCVHDATFDRTSDSAARLGPGALVDQLDLSTARTLDVGAWFSAAHTGERVATLAEALAAMLPTTVPLIEHKAGAPEAFVAELRRLDVAERCIVQSFDWRFVAAVHALAPEIALGALGPNPAMPVPDEHAMRTATACGAGLVHWQANALSAANVAAAHSRGLLVCSYTTDDELGWRGGRALGIDVMCTNHPGGMLRSQRS